MSSLAAVQVSVIEALVMVVDGAWRPVGGDGFVTSGSASVVALTAGLDAEMLPDASNAATAYSYAVLASRPESVNPGSNEVPMRLPLRITMWPASSWSSVDGPQSMVTPDT